MRDNTGSSETAWQDEELEEAALPDKRLARRLRRLLDQMSAAPGKPIPATCGDWAATKAAYRFFDNPRFTEHGVLAGHFAATVARVAASEGPILLLQDTTEFIYSAPLRRRPPCGDCLRALLMLLFGAVTRAIDAADDGDFRPGAPAALERRTEA